MAIDIDPSSTAQEIVGFGAAITDAVAYCLTSLLDPAVGANLLKAAFIYAGLSMARVPMGAADFSRMNYALSHELDTSDFCLRDDRPNATCGSDYKLDVLQSIVQIQPSLKVLVSAWSAPPSYKHQNFSCTMDRHVIRCTPSKEGGGPPQVACKRIVADPTRCLHNGQGEPCPASPNHTYSKGFPLEDTMSSAYNPKNIPMKNADGNCYHSGFVREDAYQPWAATYAKFVEEYEKAGVRTWGVTAQNEPFTQTGLWPSNFWTRDGIVEFINGHLAPALRNQSSSSSGSSSSGKGTPPPLVFAYDDQTVGLSSDALQMAIRTNASIDGVAFHWYDSLEGTYENGEPKASSPIPFNLPLVGGGADVKKVYDAFGGSKMLLMSEACSGYSLGTKYVGPRHGDTGYAYNLAHDILWSIRNRASGWISWNLILDKRGGPNLAGNFVDSPTYVLNRTHIVLNPSFYYLSHFARNVPSGSKALKGVKVQCNAKHEEYCQYVAFITPQGNTVVVLTNDEVSTRIVPSFVAPTLSKGEGVDMRWWISCGGSVVNGTLPWKSIQTVVVRC